LQSIPQEKESAKKERILQNILKEKERAERWKYCRILIKKGKDWTREDLQNNSKGKSKYSEELINWTRKLFQNGKGWIRKYLHRIYLRRKGPNEGKIMETL